MIDPGLQGKIALITGANNPLGIGAATARALAHQGCKVAITFLRLPPEKHGYQEAKVKQAAAPGLPFYHAQRTKGADELLAVIHSENGVAEALEIDLTDVANIPVLFDWVESTLGPVDIVINNAAHYDPADTIATFSAAVFDETFAVNARATVLLTAEFVRRRVRHGVSWGRVINLSTDAAQAFAGQIAYGASKAAIEAFTRSIAIETGPLGITVNTVAPGPVQSGYISAEFEAKLANEIPLRRIGQPEDIADAIVFLASEQANWITGQVIKVSGGHAL